MKHRPSLAAGTLAILAAAWSAAAAGGDRNLWAVQLDGGYAAPATTLPARPDGSLGKLRYDETERGFVIARGFGEYRGRLTPTLDAHVTADYIDDPSGGLDLTEAYLEWRPVPKSPMRQHWRFGVFHAPLSLENSGAGWTSPFTISPSAANTWFAEELRTVGAEWNLERALGARAARQRIGVHAAVFFGNDPAGSLLAWEGWSLHDAQSRLSDKLPLPLLPQLQPGAAFARQDPYVAPFREIDHRPGYYAGAEWRHGRRALVRLDHYDNRADPEAIDGGQYAWATSFDQLAAQIGLPRDVGIVMQWVDGRTAMGPVVGIARAVDARFQSGFLMATRSFGPQRISARYDRFSVEDDDAIPNDDNSESGHAWTLAYRYRHSPQLSTAVEWLQIASERPARAYLGEAANLRERLVQVRVRLRFGRLE